MEEKITKNKRKSEAVITICQKIMQKNKFYQHKNSCLACENSENPYKIFDPAKCFETDNEQISALRAEIEKKNAELAQKDKVILEKDAEIDSLRLKISEQKALLVRLHGLHGCKNPIEPEAALTSFKKINERVHLRPATIESYKTAITAFKNFSGEKGITDYSSHGVVDDFVSYLVENGYKDSTALKYRSQISFLLTELGIENKKRKQISQTTTKPKLILSEEETKPFLAALPTEYRLICEILQETGARVSSVANIMAQYVNIKKKTVYIIETKTAFSKYFPLSGELAKSLGEFIKNRDLKGYLFFPNEKKRSKIRNALNARMRRQFGKNREEYSIGAHCFRNSAAAKKFKNSFFPTEKEIESTKKFLSHKRESTTLGYIRNIQMSNNLSQIKKKKTE